MEYNYRDRFCEMWLEGKSKNEPNKDDIIKHAKERGYDLSNIKIWFNDIDEIWMFDANLTHTIKKK